MFEAGKIHNTIREMKRLNIDIMGISEMRWPGSGEYQIDEYTIYYSGNEDAHHWNDVGVIIKKEFKLAVITYIPHSDRVMMLKLRGHPFDLNIIQVYAPTSEKSDDIIEQFYEEIDECLKHTKKHEVT